jgi:hypothetical protein
MTTLREGNLELKLPAGIKGRKFDDEHHGLSNCMKAVDFIVELPDRLFFIEFKDPDVPGAAAERRAAFIKKFQAGELDENLKYKYRDTFLYEWASGNVDKPVYYWILVAINTLTPAELLTRTEELQRKLPVKGPTSGVWKRQIVAGCSVFNIETWNKNLKDYPVLRS